jgi:hypothetical protein
MRTCSHGSHLLTSPGLYMSHTQNISPWWINYSKILKVKLGTIFRTRLHFASLYNFLCPTAKDDRDIHTSSLTVPVHPSTACQYYRSSVASVGSSPFPHPYLLTWASTQIILRTSRVSVSPESLSNSGTSVSIPLRLTLDWCIYACVGFLGNNKDSEYLL